MFCFACKIENRNQIIIDNKYPHCAMMSACSYRLRKCSRSVCVHRSGMLENYLCFKNNTFSE